ncbi:MAG: class F sortase [Microbacterium sp.]|nr:MAG: class F sortase [Microbacterium sp.]
MKPSRLALGCAALLVAGALAACSPVGAEGGRAPTPSAPAGSSSATEPIPTPVASVPVTSATLAPPQPDAAPPTTLVIPSLDVEMPVSAVGVQNDGSMEIPQKPSQAGWYRYGAAPADTAGTTVLAAHVDSRVYGIGPLARLREADEGETVTVTDADGTRHRYQIESVTYIPRAELPVGDLFDRAGEPKLAIITCGGSFDEQSRTYSDNVVLIARASP